VGRWLGLAVGEERCDKMGRENWWCSTGRVRCEEICGKGRPFRILKRVNGVCGPSRQLRAKGRKGA
jgi:hypothetical protein